MAAHAAPAVLDQQGETIGYTPKGASISSISAVVHRDPLGVEGPDGQTIQYPIQIEVAQADVTTLTIGADAVALKKRLGDSSNTSYTVSVLLSQDGAMWHLGLQ